MEMKGDTDMTDTTRQREVQAIAEPIIEETIARLANAGIASHETAQAMILTGAGLLAGSLGPKNAGHDLRNVADSTARWIRQIAEEIDKTH